MVTTPETYYVKVMRGSPKHQSQFKSLKGKAADGLYVNFWLTRTVKKEIKAEITQPPLPYYYDIG